MKLSDLLVDTNHFWYAPQKANITHSRHDVGGGAAVHGAQRFTQPQTDGSPSTTGDRRDKKNLFQSADHVFLMRIGRSVVASIPQYMGTIWKLWPDDGTIGEV